MPDQTSNESHQYFEIDLRKQAPKDAIDRAITKLDKLLAEHQWKEAEQEAINIETRFAGSSRVTNMRGRVLVTFEKYKEHMMLKFLEAGNSDDVDTAMELLRELDTILAHKEASRIAKAAEHVIKAKKQRLAVQLRMAIHMEDWQHATSIGEEINRDFPNTRMATEARSLLSTLRQRADAAAEQLKPEECTSWS